LRQGLWCISGWPWTHDPPVSVSPALELQACTIIPGSSSPFIRALILFTRVDTCSLLITQHSGTNELQAGWGLGTPLCLTVPRLPLTHTCHTLDNDLLLCLPLEVSRGAGRRNESQQTAMNNVQIFLLKNSRYPPHCGVKTPFIF
jgi:hypothetical protein